MMTQRAKRIALPLLAAAVLGCGGAKAPGTGAVPGSGSSAAITPADTTPPADGTAVTSPGTATAAPGEALVPYEPMPPDTSGAGSTPIATAPPAESGTPAAPAAASGLGVFSVTMVDSPKPPGDVTVAKVGSSNTKVDELWVQVESVTVHVAGQGWAKLQGANTPVHVDLLKLKESQTAKDLGFLNLPAGTITQIRLLIGRDVSDGVGTELLNYVLLSDGMKVPLKVPSGFQTGVKIIGPWTIAACTRTAVTIDFDGHKSIWYHPNGHETEWILRPVIRVRGAVTGPTACPDPATDGTTPPGGGTTGGGTTGGSTTPGTKTIGDACTAGAECASASCVAGVCAAPSTGGGTTTPGTKAIGDACTAPAECSSGSCAGGVCTAAGGSSGGGGTGGSTTTPTKSFGDACTAPSECTSGSCVLNACTASGAGTTCAHDAECISNLCFQGSCAVSQQGGSCSISTDCATNVCTTGTCGTGSKLPVGATCNLPAECASNECSGTGGTCQPGFQGAPCTSSADCDTGLRCTLDPTLNTSSCQPPSF